MPLTTVMDRKFVLELVGSYLVLVPKCQLLLSKYEARK